MPPQKPIVMADNWLKTHWKKVLSYIFFGIVALFGSIRDALTAILPFLSNLTVPVPSLGGMNVDLLATIIGLIGLVYLLLRDTGKLHLVLRPSDRTRFAIFATITAFFWVLFAWGVDFIATSSSSPPINLWYGFFATGSFMLGIAGGFFFTVDIVGSLQGRWTAGSLVSSTIHEFFNPSPTRTKAMKDFIGLLYQFHSSWVNIWEPAIRLRSVQEKHSTAFSDLMSNLISTRAKLRAAGTEIPIDTDKDIDQFLKRGGELSAYLPTTVEVSRHQRVEPLDDEIIKTITDSGNVLATLANNTIIPNLEKTFVVRKTRQL